MMCGCWHSKHNVRISIDAINDNEKEIKARHFKETMKFSVDVEHLNVRNIKEKSEWLLSLQELQPETYYVVGQLGNVPLSDQSLFKNIVLHLGVPTVKIKVVSTMLELRNKSLWTQFTFPFGQL